MRLLLEGGTDPAIATHDTKLIAECKELVARNGIGKDHFEFQMLYGIRNALQRKLAQEGYRVRCYVPFGTCWLPYFMRRLRERRANVLFVLRNLFRR
jgi:proline dehydrogenase